MSKKYAFKQGRLYISIEEATALLNEFADAALLPGGAETLRQVAKCFERIESETLGAFCEVEI